MFGFVGLGSRRVRGHLHSLPSVTDRTLSVRNKIKNYEGEEYYYGRDFFPRCLYAEEVGDPSNVRRGYLRSALLVKVFAIPLL